MRKVSIIFITILMIIFSLNAIAFAEKTEWKDKNYDFSKIKKILISFNVPPENSAYIQDPYIEKYFPDFLIEYFNKKGIHAETLADMLKNMNDESNGNLAHIAQNNNDEFKEMMVRYIKNNYDGVINFKVLRYMFGSATIQESTYQTTEYDQTTISDVYGNIATATTPKTVTHTIPAHEAESVEVNIDIQLFDTQTDSLVFARNDDRMAINAPPFKTAPKAMGERIAKSYINDLAKLIKKK